MKMMKFDLPIWICPICNKQMMPKATRFISSPNLFTTRLEDTQQTQMKKLGIVFMYENLIENICYCVNCIKEGKAIFHCSLCENDKTSNKIQFSVGDPPEYLCHDCYITVTANIWENKIKELEEEHMWDWE